MSIRGFVVYRCMRHSKHTTMSLHAPIVIAGYALGICSFAAAWAVHEAKPLSDFAPLLYGLAALPPFAPVYYLAWRRSDDLRLGAICSYLIVASFWLGFCLLQAMTILVDRGSV